VKLPKNEIGISDILDYRECAQRFGFSMLRHEDMPDRFKLEDGEKADPQERQSWAGAYGSCVHDAIEEIEKDQCSNDEAIDRVWPKWHHWLEPGDMADISADLDVYRTRSVTGFRLVGTEIEMRVPLFVHEGEVIYFRGRIDVLYQRLDNESVFLSRDYKSSRMPKTEEEVHKDIQQWAYNFMIHEKYPECTTLVQEYDQLKFGKIPTRKNAAQREQIKQWLVRQVKTMLADDTFKPTSNKWCYTCPLMMDCRVTHMATDFWVNRLAALAPEKKEGRKIVVQLTKEHAGFEIYVELLPKIKNAQKIMERFAAAVEEVLKEMPKDEREQFGYRFGKPPEKDVFDADALRRVREVMGDDFFHVAAISKKALSDFYGDSSPEYQAVMQQSRKELGTPRLLAPRP
jgi:hypothetical protein